MRYTPSVITSTYAAVTALNSNFADIQALLEKCVFTDGTSPNSMLAALDMNHFKVQNLADGANETDAVNVGQLRSLVAALLGTGFIGSVASVEQYGAVGNGSVDDLAAFNAAKAAVGVGGTILLGPKTYCLSDTFTLDKDGVKLIGVGHGNNHDVGSTVTAATKIKYIGSAGGTPVKVKSSTNQVISGNEIRGIFFDGNNNLAAIGVNLVGCRQGIFEIVGRDFSAAVLKTEPDPALGEAAGFSENRITLLSGYQTAVGSGAILLSSSTSSWNCSQNIYEIISGDFAHNPAIQLNGDDSETFQVIKLYSSDGTTGVRLKGGATANQATRNNMFHYVAVTNATVPVFASGTSFDTSPSVQNNILFLDTANNPNLPSIDTGASLWWGTLKSPIGTRSFSIDVGSGTLSQQLSSGLLAQAGLSSSVTAGSFVTINFPTAYGTGVVSVSVTPKTNTTKFKAVASATQLIISNDATGTATDFYWEVKGI